MTKDIHDTIYRLEESLWKAETRFDVNYMEEVLHPKFFEFGRSGSIYNRAGILSYNSGTIDTVFPLKDFQLHHISDEIIQATYISQVTYDGMLEKANRSSIWKKEEDEWKLIFHQGTPTE
jgi:hypothetical protein